MTNNLYFHPGNKYAASAPAQLSLIRVQHKIHIRVKCEAYNKDFSIYGDTLAIIDVLQRLLEKARPTNGLPGIDRGEIEPSLRRFTYNIRLEDIPQDNPEEAWPLIAMRFPWLQPYIEKKFLNTRATTPRNDDDDQLDLPAENSEAPAQLANDLEAIEDIPQELLIKDGQIIFRAQARIAEALGVSNSGGHRKRILAVCRELKRRYRIAENDEADVERKAA